MVVRRAKKARKFLGTRRWGVGNIKNARGAGGRGGVGALARLRKHDWTYYTAKAPELIRKKGFAPWKRSRLNEITLERISAMESASKSGEVELDGYKVLSNGTLSKPIVIRATAFSKAAIGKIEGSGGKAIVIAKRVNGPAKTTEASAK
jgi:large subunit ribosomal protein L15